MNYYNFALDEYQKYNKLTKKEINILPIYLKAAHAMHVIGAGKEKYKEGNKSEENRYWLSQGRKGLQDMNVLFN
jgi:Ser/Thr protein kinase RdoA (MazF antagonist)